MASLLAETRIGSDRVPLILSSVEERLRRSPKFFFETTWFEVDEFDAIVKTQWYTAARESGHHRPPPPLELWVAQAARLCAFLRGRGGQSWSRRQGRVAPPFE